MENNLSNTIEENSFVHRVRKTLKESGNCAQTSFFVLQEEFGFEGNQVLRALTPFPGIALRGETCGAVIGCLMALGLEFGRDDLSDWRGYIGSLPAARRFCNRFERENGSTECGHILKEKLGRKYDLANKTDSLEYASSGGPEACVMVVASAVKIASELISNKR